MTMVPDWAADPVITTDIPVDVSLTDAPPADRATWQSSTAAKLQAGAVEAKFAVIVPKVETVAAVDAEVGDATAMPAVADQSTNANPEPGVAARDSEELAAYHVPP